MVAEVGVYTRRGPGVHKSFSQERACCSRLFSGRARPVGPLTVCGPVPSPLVGGYAESVQNPMTRTWSRSLWIRSTGRGLTINYTKPPPYEDLWVGVQLQVQLCELTAGRPRFTALAGSARLYNWFSPALRPYRPVLCGSSLMVHYRGSGASEPCADLLTRIGSSPDESVASDTESCRNTQQRPKCRPPPRPCSCMHASISSLHVLGPRALGTPHCLETRDTSEVLEPTRADAQLSASGTAEYHRRVLRCPPPFS